MNPSYNGNVPKVYDSRLLSCYDVKTYKIIITHISTQTHTQYLSHVKNAECFWSDHFLRAIQALLRNC
jgi:hypothetical protein